MEFEKKSIGMVIPRIPPDYAGGGKRMARYARKLAKEGYDVKVLTLTNNPTQIEGVDINVLGFGVLYRKVPKTVKRLIECLHIPKMIFKENVDVLHCGGAFWITLLFVASAKLFRIRSILEITLNGVDDPDSVYSQRLGFIKWLMYKSANHYVVVSPDLKKELDKNGISSEKCSIIPNSVDKEYFKKYSTEKKRRKKKNRGLDRFEKIITNVGILKKRKNQEECVEIFSRVAQEHENIALLLVGPTKKDEKNIKYAEKLKMACQKLDIREQVLFTGRQRDVKFWLGISDIFMFTSMSEGCPNALLEAMSMSVPCIVKRSTGSEFVVKDTKSGLTYGTIEEGAEKLNFLLSEENIANSIACEGRRRVKRLFSDESVLKQYMSLYSSPEKET